MGKLWDTTARIIETLHFRTFETTTQLFKSLIILQRYCLFFNCSCFSSCLRLREDGRCYGRMCLMMAWVRTRTRDVIVKQVNGLVDHRSIVSLRQLSLFNGIREVVVVTVQMCS